MSIFIYYHSLPSALQVCRGYTSTHHRPSLLRFLPATGCGYGSGSTVGLVVEAWAQVLSRNWDGAFARHICTGLKYGFRISFRQGTRLRSASANMGSARERPSVVTEYLTKESSLGRMLGPFTPESQIPSVHINHFGVIPKGHNTGKWRYGPAPFQGSQR